MSEPDEDDTTAPTRQVPAGLPLLKPPPKALRQTKDLLSFYLAEVRRYPLLTPEEEKEYAVKYTESGDAEAAERLVTANLRLVIKIAFQYHRQWANVLDLIQEGNVGLVEALSRYDPYRNVRFSSYAQYWIRAMILRFLMDNYTLVRLGGSRAGRKLFYQLKRERDRLIEMGVDASPKAIAERLGVSEEEVNAVDQHMRAPALSLDAPAGDEGGRTLSEVVPDHLPNNPELQASRNERNDMLRVRFDRFAAEYLQDDRERAIWERRMVAQDVESLAVLGAEFGVSKERIRQVEERLKQRVKAFLEAEFGDEVVFEFASPDDD